MKSFLMAFVAVAVLSITSQADAQLFQRRVVKATTTCPNCGGLKVKTYRVVPQTTYVLAEATARPRFTPLRSVLRATGTALNAATTPRVRYLPPTRRSYAPTYVFPNADCTVEQIMNNN